MRIENSVIGEVSESEEHNTTQLQLGKEHLAAKASREFLDPYAEADRKADKLKAQEGVGEGARDRNRDSMFGTMLLTNTISKEHEARMIHMKDPHQVMQQ